MKKLLQNLKNFIIKKRIAKKRPIFIVGCGHSGTSILFSILDYHKDLFSVKEETYIFKKTSINYSQLNKIFENAGKRRWVEKTPGHVHEIPKILSVFPKAQFIVILRDGRDVACSIKERNGDFYFGVERWLQDNLAWLKYENAKFVYVLKLEDLTHNPEEELKKLLLFLDLNYYDDLLNYHKEKRNFFNNATEKQHITKRKYQVNAPLQKNTNRWKKEMNEEESRYFNKKAGKLMQHLGYYKNTQNLNN